MKKSTILISTLLLVLSYGFGQTPLFTTIDTSYCQGEEILFTNLHTDFCGYSYIWDFGDGSQDTARNHIKHTYTQPGQYSPTLTITGANYFYVLKAIQVNDIPVLPWINVPFDLKPDIYFEFKGQGCDRHDFTTSKTPSDLDLPHTFNFNRNLGKEVFTVELWDYDKANFDDFIGSFTLDLTAGNGSYIYGDFDITWTVDSIPLQPFSINMNIDPGPTVPQIQATGPTKVCGLADVKLYASSDPGIALQWYKNDVAIPNANGDTLVATETGWYKVEAINPTGCSPFSIAERVLVQPIPDPKIINASTSKPLPIYICRTPSNIIVGETTLYGGRSKSGGPDFHRVYYDFTWFNNGDTVSNKWDGFKEEEEIVLAPGAYWVIVTDSLGCSGVSDTVHFDVFDQQTAEIFTKDSLALCLDDTIHLPTNVNQYLNYQWYKDNIAVPDSLGGNLQSLAVVEAGNYYVEIEDQKPCFQPSVSASVYVFETGVPGPQKPSINLNGSDVFCFGESTLLSVNNDPNLSYQWLQNGDSIHGANTSDLTVTSDGKYQISVSDALGCDNTSAFQVIEVAAPLSIISSLGKDLKICEGDTTLLIAEGDFMDNFQWFYQGNPVGNDPVLMASNLGLYELVASSSLSCPDTIASGNLTYFSIPNLEIDRNKDTLFAGPALSYQWLHSGSGTLLSEDPYFIPTKPGPYYVAIIDTNGCENTSDITNFYLTSIDPEVPELLVKVYPNPSNGLITVQTGSNGSGISQARFFTLNGQEILSKEIRGNTAEFDLSFLPAGVYFLKLEKDNYHSNMKKIVIRR